RVGPRVPYCAPSDEIGTAHWIPTRVVVEGLPMKIISWKVNGIRALLNRNLLSPFVATYDPDVLCLQETKAQPGQVRLDLPSHPYHYWNGATRKGYAGTAVIAKTAPLSVRMDLGVARHDGE